MTRIPQLTYGPWQRWLWRLFLLWTAIGAVVMSTGWGEPEIREHIGWPPLQSFLIAVEEISDFAWMALAALLALMSWSRRVGTRCVLLAAAIIAVGAGLVEVLGVLTGFPFGDYTYTGRFGWLIGGVLPLGIPLAWWVVLAGAWVAAGWLPGARRPAARAGWAAAIAVLTDINLEHVAWKVRGYWIWYPDQAGAVPAWPPVENFIAWAVLSWVLLMAAMVAPASCRNRWMTASPPLLPLAILITMNLLFIVVRIADRF